MKMELTQVVNKGMQRDYAMNTASQEFAYENKNIRITSTGNNSFLSVTNEKSTKQIKLVKGPYYIYYDVEKLYMGEVANPDIIKSSSPKLVSYTITFESPLPYDHVIISYKQYKSHTVTERKRIEKGTTIYQYPIGPTADGEVLIDMSIESYNKTEFQLVWKGHEQEPGYTKINDDIIGATVIGSYIVLFTISGVIYETSNIYRCQFKTIEGEECLLCESIYTGNLGFKRNNPIECITYYESEDVQKVYWVDGINQPRVINIRELGQTSNTSNLEFVPKIEKQPVVTIEKEQNGAGLFPSGVVQYYITYYKKFNQETHTAYTSPLYYISPDDKGGEADSIQTCSFRIRITDVDPKYDYVRVYSLVRTSKNFDYVVSIVGDINIKNSGDTYQIIDTNTNLINVPSSDILFLGGNVIIPSTIEQKDNTLFLGNITTGTNTISDEITSLKKAFTTIRENNELSNLLKFVYKVVPVKNEDNTTLYPYNPNLESNLYDTHFKLREKYRVGIQLINDVGESTQTIYVGDIINENHYPHYMSQDVMNDFSIDYKNPIKVDNHYIDDSGNIHLYDILDTTVSYSDFLCLPIITFDFNSSFETIISNLKKKGFTNYKLVIAETDYKDRSILCQGYVNPLTFKLGRRKNNTCYSQESWAIRPIGTYQHLKNINKCNNNEYTELSEIRGSLSEDLYKEDAMIPVTPNTNTNIRSITLSGYCTNYNSWSDDHLLYYIITVHGTDKNNNEVSVSFRFDGDWSYTYANCYDYDIVPYFHTFDVWTQDKINSINNKFGTSSEELQGIGFIIGERIFGDGALPHHSLTPDGYCIDHLYYITSRAINANLGSEDLDITGKYKEQFFLDASQMSFNTPDLENIQDIIASNPNLKCRIVGKINIDRVTTDYNINLEDTIDGDTATTIYKFKLSKILNVNENAVGIKNFPAVWSSKDSRAYNLMLLEKDGSTITNGTSSNPGTDPSDGTPTATLKNKLIGNLWYASKTDYEFHWRYNLVSTQDPTNIIYYPSNNFSKDEQDIATILSLYTTNKENQAWYSNLIYCNLDLQDNKISLWDSDKYIKNNLYLSNIDDISYNKDWKWLRSRNAVTSFTTLNTLKENLSHSDIVSLQNQIQIKYNKTNNILLFLKPSYSDIHCLPGYANFNLEGKMSYLWDKKNYYISDKVVNVLWFNIDTGRNPNHFIYFNDIDDKNPDTFYIDKECWQNKTLTIENNKDYYISIEEEDDDRNLLFPNYTIVQSVDFNNEEDKKFFDSGFNEDAYYKFKIVNSDSSYSITFDGEIYPAFKGKLVKGNEIFEHKIKPLYTYGDFYVEDFYLNSLNSTLRGDYFLTKNINYIDDNSFYLHGGFYPSNYIKRYLPFNLNSTEFLDKPSYLEKFGNHQSTTRTSNIEGNGINNSLWVCELYKDFDDFEFLGGTSENAIELNTFIPASQACPIGSTIYGLYGDTYFKRWDNLRVYPMNEEQTNGIVDVVSLMLETHVNLDGDTRSARKRLDITNMRPSNMEGLVNPVYSQSNNVITSNVLDDKFNVSSHPLQYWWSLPKTNLSEIDNWTHVVLTRVGELDGDKGPLNKIKRWNNYLFAFQDKGIAQINFNNQTVIGGQEGIPVEIANSGKVQGHYYITTNNGCKNKWSIVESPAGLYFIDSYNKSIMLLGDGLKSLSQLNLFQDWIEQNEHGNVWNTLRREPAFKSFYDPIHSEVYFANGEHCLCYNELLQQFTSFYDYENLNYMFLLDGHIYGINYQYPSSDPVQLHKMFEGEDYCNLFGKQCEYYMQYKINKDPFVDKTWTNLEYRADIFNTGNIQSNKDYDSDNIISNKTFDTLKVWNEYQSGELDLNKVRMNYLKDAKSRFRVWRTNMPRAKKTETNKYGLDRIRNPWIMLELKKTEDTSKRMEFHDLVIKYVI